jgi:hypothetical protein
MSQKQAVSPYIFVGEHDHEGTLDPLVVDAIHRIIVDQTHITKSYVHDNLAKGLSQAKYIALAGITVVTLSVDEFNRALGLPLEPLPEPIAGPPNHYRPAPEIEGTGFLPMIPTDGNVLRAFSSVPDAVRAWMAVGAAQ